MNEIPNEALAVIQKMSSDIIYLRKACNDSIVRIKEMADEFEELNAKVAARQATIDAHLKTIEMLRADRNEYSELVAKYESERDSARRKLYALAQAVNCLHGCEKAKQPRLFLIQFAENVKKVIREQDIHLTPEGMAK